MANPTLVQSASAASSAASPATITPTLGSPSTAKSLLLLSVIVSGSATAIATPAGWTLVTTAANSNNQLSLFSRPNNPGGITAVAVTITATGGGAAASIFEFSGTNNVQEAFGIASAGGQSTVVTQVFSAMSNVLQIGELTFLTFGDNDTGSAPTLVTTGEFSANTAPAVSTSGIPNVRIANFFGVNNGPSTPQLLNGGSLGGATNYVSALVRFQGAGAFITYGAGGGVFVGTGGNPAGSLQVPQPQGQGQYSGSAGSF